MKKTISIVACVTVLCVALSLGAFAAGSSYTKNLLANYVGVQLVVDGVTVIPKDANGNIVEPFIVDGTTYLPVRAVAEALGREVSWDGTTQTVYINDKEPVTDPVLVGSVGLEYTLTKMGTYIVIGIGTCTDAHVVIPAEYNGAAVTGIGEYAFFRCTALTGITIPESVTGIGDYAFCGCSNLNDMIIPDGVTIINESAFEGCTSMTNITIPGSVTGIGYAAFSDCKSLTDIAIPDSVTDIGPYAFSGCTNLSAITISESVTNIGSGAFRECSSLTGITIPGSITGIGYFTFSGCKSLTNITIPGSVTGIGYSAFYGCQSLTNITYTGTAAQWEAIEKEPDWNGKTGEYTVHCTDGDISK